MYSDSYFMNEAISEAEKSLAEGGIPIGAILVKDNEPNVALFGGKDGLKFYKIILSGAKEILNDKAIIAFEHGYNKTKEIEDIARYYFPNAKIISKKDLEGLDRMTFVIVGDFNE